MTYNTYTVLTLEDVFIIEKVNLSVSVPLIWIYNTGRFLSRVIHSRGLFLVSVSRKAIIGVLCTWYVYTSGICQKTGIISDKNNCDLV